MPSDLQKSYLPLSTFDKLEDEDEDENHGTTRPIVHVSQPNHPGTPWSEWLPNHKALELLLSFSFLILLGLGVADLGPRIPIGSSQGRPRVQAIGLKQTELSRVRAAKVKEAFEFAWDGYKKYAWGHDESKSLKPMSLGFDDTRNKWGATIVDSLTTLWVMDMKDELEGAINFTTAVDFTRSGVVGQPTSLFETTIRYIGGMLSAYELTNSTNYKLVEQATVLANTLSHTWDNNQTIPTAWIYFDTLRSNGQQTISLAEAGTLTIEFDRLSLFTGNDTYRQLADRTSRKLMADPQVLPGMHAQSILSLSGQTLNKKTGWGANGDSFMEYGVKYWQLVGSNATDYISYWNQSVASSIDHLLFKPAPHMAYLGEYSYGRAMDSSSQLACFAPGNWLLGGKLLQNETIVQAGLELAEGCAAAYNMTATGLGPEGFRITSDRLLITHRNFMLRPETIESFWYAYRITGDPIWQERAWNVFEALERYCKTKVGYAGINNVDSLNPIKDDKTESFLFGELFKYLYLIFAPPDLLSLDHYVLNTEAHPFLIRPL